LPISAPKIQDVQLHSCFVEWQVCKPMGPDSISYCLQLYCRDQDYKQVQILYFMLIHILMRNTVKLP